MSARSDWERLPAVSLYLGQEFLTVPRRVALSVWVRQQDTARLTRLVNAPLRAIGVTVEDVRWTARDELARRQPSRDRVADTANAVGARRRWVVLVPVITNYSNGG